MKKVISLILFLSFSFLAGCNNEDGLLQDLMKGVIGGQEWQFQYAKGFFQAFENEFTVEIYGQFETASDPCGINSILGYVSVTLPNQEGTYTLPFPDESTSVKFNQPGVGQQFFVATNGFVEIISIEGRRVAGYMQANFDDQNFVEGTFIFDRCN